jgi:hypothetical protein
MGKYTYRVMPSIEIHIMPLPVIKSEHEPTTVRTLYFRIPNKVLKIYKVTINTPEKKIILGSVSKVRLVKQVLKQKENNFW